MPENRRIDAPPCLAGTEIRSTCSVEDYGDVSAEYAAVADGAAIVDLGCRTRLELAGTDRAAFLHNFCSNEIRKLPVGAGCEAFLLNSQGRILAHVLALVREESILLETVPGAAEALMEHLERYHIREDLTLCDRGKTWGELFLAGPQVIPIVNHLITATAPESHLSGIDVTIAGDWCSWWRINLGRLQGFLAFFPAEKQSTVWDLLVSAGARPCGSSALEMARIEAGWPLYGRDISDRNLPQEVNRDRQAINFVKGCYLGQETVARIDALGHANKFLVMLKFDLPEVPVAGTLLTRAGESVGEVTSACASPRWGGCLALAYVRRGSQQPGTRLESAAGPCDVFSPDEPTA